MPCERVYARTSDYANWTGNPAPPEMDRAVLARASRRIDRALIGAIYATDTDGMPTDPDIREAIRDATCAQVEWWWSQGDKRGTGVVAEWDSVSVGDVTLTRASGGGSAGGGGRSVRKLADAAAELLVQAGLMHMNPQVNG